MEAFSVEGRKVVVLGMLEGRDPAAILGPLHAAGIDHVVCVTPDTPRAMPVEKIVTAAAALGLSAEAAPSIDAAVEIGLGLVADDGLLLATGSLYVVGDARARLMATLGHPD